MNKPECQTCAHRDKEIGLPTVHCLLFDETFEIPVWCMKYVKEAT